MFVIFIVFLILRISDSFQHWIRTWLPKFFGWLWQKVYKT